MRYRLLVGLLSVVFSTLPLPSQINTGTILGTVRDTQGSVIPGAEITVTQTELGVAVELTTNEAGVYQAAGLRPGAYRVRAETDGFKAAVRGRDSTLHPATPRSRFHARSGRRHRANRSCRRHRGGGHGGRPVGLRHRRRRDCRPAARRAALLRPDSAQSGSGSGARNALQSAQRPESTSTAISRSRTTSLSTGSITTPSRPMPRNGVRRRFRLLPTRSNPSRSRRGPTMPSSAGAKAR